MVHAVHTTDWNLPVNRMRIAEAPARPRGRVTGGWIADLVALEKAIALCGLCVNKFDAAKHGYVTKMDIPFVRGECDGCRQYADRARLFLKAR